MSHKTSTNITQPNDLSHPKPPRSSLDKQFKFISKFLLKCSPSRFLRIRQEVCFASCHQENGRHPLLIFAINYWMTQFAEMFKRKSFARLSIFEVVNAIDLKLSVGVLEKDKVKPKLIRYKSFDGRQIPA
ncbi:MAG: hypothetical protein NZ805_14665 [Armatimonadetes bacterium]|nr:hypothetical protein [Armatimonadota bacterium]